MSFRLGVGKSDFEEMRKVGDYYVDKSELLYELVENVGNKVTLFTRPRRFGKTLMMSMIDSFFNVREDSRAIIIEAKKSANRADMEADCGAALEQIDARKYADGLYGYTQILCYGVAFFQKEALVRKGA